MSMRETVVELAKEHLGEVGWRQYLPGTALDPGSRVSWCGIFALNMLHRAGLAPDIRWEYGKGFAYKLPRTRNPLPGDIAYIDQPHQHHAIVESVSPDGEVVTIDGNQPNETVARRVRRISEFSAFYSIAPLLNDNEVAT